LKETHPAVKDIMESVGLGQMGGKSMSKAQLRKMLLN
jgi:hypothetical protein